MVWLERWSITSIQLEEYPARSRKAHQGIKKKFEARNSKQFQMTKKHKVQNKVVRVRGFGNFMVWAHLVNSFFRMRYSNLEFSLGACLAFLRLSSGQASARKV